MFIFHMIAVINVFRRSSAIFGSFLFMKNSVFPVQAELSYFSTDCMLKLFYIFLIIAYNISD